MSQTILNLQDLHVTFSDENGDREVVSGIDLTINKGEIVGVVGESGSGKSVSFMSITGLIPKAKVSAARCDLLVNNNMVPLLKTSIDEIREIRRSVVSYVFQEPMTALNPLMRCGKQVEEALQEGEGKDKVIQLFNEVELPKPERIYKAYPHELSGGQRQRVMIAMALASDPVLLIADEPTTALDPLVQKSVVELLAKTCADRQMAMVFISHDLDLVARISDRILVMAHGAQMEMGSAEDVYYRPNVAYTKMLLSSRPRYSQRPSTNKIIGKVALQATSLVKEYRLKNKGVFKALDEVSFELREGESLGLIGESGSGKSTIGKITVDLLAADGGKVKRVDASAPQREVQMVFQDPFSSLNPKQRIEDAITEPMLFHKLVKNRKEAKAKAVELLKMVDMDESSMQRYPHEFSGGQRQRICIARALAVDPKILVCDESVSALDVSVQAKVLDVLHRIQLETGIAYLFISHDLNVVSYLCDRIIVLKNGKIVEEGKTATLLSDPQETYTRSLLDSVVR